MLKDREPRFVLGLVVATPAWVWFFALLSSLGPSSIGLEKTGDVEKGTLFVTFAMMLTGIVQAILFLSQLRIMNQSLRGCLETFGEGGWPGRGVIPDGCRSQSGQPHVDPGHPSPASPRAPAFR